jgi:hypothetical protein
MKKFLIFILPIIVIIGIVLWYFFDLTGMLMTIGTVLLVVLLFVFLVVKWNEFVEKNIKD